MSSTAPSDVQSYDDIIGQAVHTGRFIYSFEKLFFFFIVAKTNVISHIVGQQHKLLSDTDVNSTFTFHPLTHKKKI